MYSFYGGKQGRTYNLVQRYDQIYIDQTTLDIYSSSKLYKAGDRFTFESGIYLVLPQEGLQSFTLSQDDLKDDSKVAVIRGMVNEFQKGGAYTDANYGQYVIIDTILNRNHKDDDTNGIIYRRGFDYTQASAGNRPQKDDQTTATIDGVIYTVPAYYDYTIVNGKVSIGQFNENKWVAAWRKYILKPGGGAIYVGQIVGPQGDSPELVGQSWEDFLKHEGKISIEPISDTPGVEKDGNNWEYNDTIKFGHCTIKDDDGNVTGAYVSFDIPYNVFKVSAQSVDPYGKDSRTFKDEVSGVTQTVSPINATYDSSKKKWTYDGLIQKHDSTGNDAGHPFYWNYDIAIPSGIHGRDVEDIKKETAAETNAIAGKTVIEINEQVDVHDDSYVASDDQYINFYTRDYNTGADGVLSAPSGNWPYRVIKEIITNLKERTYYEWGLDAASVGDLYKFEGFRDIFAVCITAGNTSNDEPPELNNTGSSDYYTLGHMFSSGTSQWRVVNIPETAPPRSLDIDYYAGKNDLVSDTRCVDYLTLDDNGGLYVVYSDSEEPYYLSNINGIRTIYFNEDDGHLYIEYSNGSQVDFELKSVDSIELINQDDITKTQQFVVKYKGLQTESVSNALNSVLSVSRYGDNVIVLYSDPDYRDKIQQEGIQDVDYYLLPYQDEYNSYNSLVWVNLGPIGAQYHVQGQYSIDDLKPGGVIENGFTGELSDRAGWIITVVQDGVIALYAYDYNGTHIWPDDGTETHWYKIKDLDSNMVQPYLSVRLSAETRESGLVYEDDNLNENGLWFVVSGGHD